MRRLAWFLAALAAGCASPAYVLDPHPSETDPEHGKAAYLSSGTMSTPSGAGDAVIAAGAAAIDTALGVGPDFPRKSPPPGDRIHGRCEFLSAGATLPCSSVLILLNAGSGENLIGSRTDANGVFWFPVSRGQNYGLTVQSAQFQVRFEPAPPFRAGSEVLVKLTPKSDS